MADPAGVEGSQLVDGMCAGAFLKGPPKYHPSSKEGAQLSTLDQIKHDFKDETITDLNEIKGRLKS